MAKATEHKLTERTLFTEQGQLTGPGEGISLGALILALGMLVDNAIVVVEGILVNIQRGAALRKPQFSFVQTAPGNSLLV